MESAHSHDLFNEINSEKWSQAVPMISIDEYLDFNQWSKFPCHLEGTKAK